MNRDSLQYRTPEYAPIEQNTHKISLTHHKSPQFLPKKSIDNSHLTTSLHQPISRPTIQRQKSPCCTNELPDYSKSSTKKNAPSKFYSDNFRRPNDSPAGNTPLFPHSTHAHRATARQHPKSPQVLRKTSQLLAKSPLFSDTTPRFFQVCTPRPALRARLSHPSSEDLPTSGEKYMKKFKRSDFFDTEQQLSPEKV